MNAKTIYGYTPIRTEKEHIYTLEKHVQEIRDARYGSLDLSRNERIELRYYADECSDGRRGWALFSVWFDENPVMICQRAGRENDDCTDEFITNAERYKAMAAYLLSLRDEEEEARISAYSEEEEIENLTSFYGCDLFEFYAPETVHPSYKAGDIVVAVIKEDHIRDAYAFEKVVYIRARCEIKGVDPHNPRNTYHMLQLDRRWETREELLARGAENLFHGKMVHAVGEGQVWAHANESQILGYAEAPIPPDSELYLYSPEKAV